MATYQFAQVPASGERITYEDSRLNVPNNPITPELAMALNNQANIRSEVGDRAGALAAVDQAVTFYRGLAGDNPAAFTRNLVRPTRIMADLLSAEYQAEAAATWTRSREAVPPPLRSRLSVAAAQWHLTHGENQAARAALMDAALVRRV